MSVRVAGPIAVIGGGTMGETFIRAVTDAGLTEASGIRVCEKLPPRRAQLSADLGVAVTDSINDAAADAAYVYLSIKPQDLASLNGASIAPEQVVVSIMAGVPLHQLGGALGHNRIVRAMPNTPAQVGRGFTVWTADANVSSADRDGVRALLAAMGDELYVENEGVIDQATAVSGSGPAYVFLLLEAMINGAVSIGLNPADARRMVLETVIGSAEFAAQSGRHPAELKDMVTSPGGTTAAGLRALEAGGVRSALIEAIAAAHARAQELGQS